MTNDKGQPAEPVGYLISKDRYLKRDELGVIFQLCVVPGMQRGLIGATLLKAAFERAAYGCRLFCCWCAQDLDANRFWEAMGFVPLAFRMGSDRKKRVHIFWQKRICEGDDGQGGTPWWFPFQTGGGAIRQDRIVLPIPPGVHWSEVRGVEVPVTPSPVHLLTHAGENRGGERVRGRGGERGRRSGRGGERGRRSANAPGPGKVGILVGGRIKYVDRPGYVAPAPAVAPVMPLLPAPVKPKRERVPRAKIDPAFLAKVRELRDRYLEHVNFGGGALPASGKYDVKRVLPPVSPAAAAGAVARALPDLRAEAA